MDGLLYLMGSYERDWYAEENRFRGVGGWVFVDDVDWVQHGGSGSQG